MDPNDLYAGNQPERANGFQDDEQPASHDTRDGRELDTSTNQTEAAGGRPSTTDPPQPHHQQQTGVATAPNNPPDSEKPAVSDEQNGSAPQTGSETNLGSDPAQAEEETNYAPGFPKKMEVVVLALVRVSEEMDSDWVTELPKGTIVQVVEIVGRRARITHPFPGWMSIRTDDGVTILTEPDGTVRIGARIVYKDFHKKVSIQGTVIDKDDRRSVHLVEFENGSKEWMNLNCKEVEIISTGRDNELTAQVNGTTQLNYFAEVFAPQSERRGDATNGSHDAPHGSPMPAATSTGRSLQNGRGPRAPAHPRTEPTMPGHPSRNGPTLPAHPNNGPTLPAHPNNGGPRLPRRPHHPYAEQYSSGLRGHGAPGGRVVDPRYPDRYANQHEMDAEYSGQYGSSSSSWSRGSRRGNGAAQDSAPSGLHGHPPGRSIAPPRPHPQSMESYDAYGEALHERARDSRVATTTGTELEYPDYSRSDRSGAVPGYGDAAGSTASGASASGRGRSVKGFIVLRGLPGSGKTTLAKKLASRAPQSRICTEDRYHWTSGEDGVGEYKFKREVLFFARDWCNKEVKNAVTKGVDLVILDNCNARISMYEELINFAVTHKYRFRIIEFIATPELVDRYAGRSLKGFPREVYLKLLKLWERDPRAELINPCFDDAETAAPVPPVPRSMGGMHPRGGHVSRDMPPSYYPMDGSPPRQGMGQVVPDMGRGHAPPHGHPHNRHHQSRRYDHGDGYYY